MEKILVGLDPGKTSLWAAAPNRGFHEGKS